MDFLKEISSSSPLPAGGAALAYTAALAIGLMQKVMEREMARGHGPDMEKNLHALRKEVERLLKDMEKLITEDPETYTSYAKSLRSGDKMEMKRFFSNILDVSLKVMEKSDAAFTWADQLRMIAPERMMPHLLVACELLMGAINATVHIVRDNLQPIKSEKKKEAYLKRIEKLRDDCQEKYKAVVGRFQ